jgi:hypothetical protein
MPNTILNSFSKKSGKSISELERMWAALDAAYDPKIYNNRYAFIVGVMKKNLGIRESSSFNRIVSEMLERSSVGFSLK